MCRNSRPAFSLTSLLFLLALLVFLAGLFFPLIGRLRQAATRTQGINQMRQMAIAAHSYHDAHNGLPPTVGKLGKIEGTLFYQMLPYIEQEPLFQRGSENWTNVLDQVVPLYLDPADPSAPQGNVVRNMATTSYAGNWKLFAGGGVFLGAIADGTSNTIMFTQRYQVCNGTPTAWPYNRLHYSAPAYGFYSSARFQLAPAQERCDPGLPQALTTQGIVIVFADASARLASPECSPQTWLSATEPADGMALGDDL